MSLKQLLCPTGRHIRWTVGVGLLGLACLQCASPSEAFKEADLICSINGQEVGKVSPPMAARIEKLCQSDHLALLRLCLANYDRNVQDYTCTFIKRERLHGKDGQGQEIKVKFLNKPFSVAMRWVKNAPIGDRCLYVEGKHEGNMLVRPKGLLKWVGTVRRKPDSPEVLANTLRPINMFGFRRGLARLIGVYELAGKRGELETAFEGYKMVAGRKTAVLVRTLPARQEYPAAITRIYIDTQRLLPLCIEAWDWDGKLDSRYIYKDVTINVGLTSEDFDPAKNGL